MRGGIAVWKSVDMSNAGEFLWTTPIRDWSHPCPGRNWRMEETPSLTIHHPTRRKSVADVPEKKVKPVLTSPSEAVCRAWRRSQRCLVVAYSQELWRQANSLCMFDCNAAQEAGHFVPAESKPLLRAHIETVTDSCV